MKAIKRQSPCISILLQSFVTIMLLCSVTSALAKEKAHIIVKAAEGVSPTKLVISKYSEDPANSPHRTKHENGIYEIDIETDLIESYEIIDWT